MKYSFLRKVIELVKKIPLSTSGLAFAIALMGDVYVTEGTIFKNICGILSVVIMILLVIKIALCTHIVSNELKSPVVLSNFCTFDMALMMIAMYLSPVVPTIATILWIFAIAMHLFIGIIVTYKYTADLNIRKIFPSFLVTYCGITVIGLTASSFQAYQFGRMSFYFGISCFIALFPTILYRIVKYGDIKKNIKGTIAVMALPSSLCLGAYLTSFQIFDSFILRFLIIMSVTSTFITLLFIPKLNTKDFYTSIAAFSYPFVTSAYAMKVLVEFFMNKNVEIFDIFGVNIVPILPFIMMFEQIIAMILLVYVIFRFYKHLFIKKKIKKIRKMIKAKRIKNALIEK